MKIFGKIKYFLWVKGKGETFLEERDIYWSEKNGDGKGREYLEEENNYLCGGKGKGGTYL